MESIIYKFLIISLFSVLFSCQQDPIENLPKNNIPTCKKLISPDKYFPGGDRMFLYGGTNDTMHFDVTNWEFDTCRLGLGLGRETFPALTHPDYHQELENINLHDMDSCLVVVDNGVYKVFPHNVMSYHEAINETVNGESVLIAYCKLANLGAVYKRTICKVPLDFAISGYVYSEELVYGGISSFVMWDRQTESLWWPLNNIGVSGFFKNELLIKYDETKWFSDKWKNIKENYSPLEVLYTQNPPSHDNNYKESIDCK